MKRRKLHASKIFDASTFQFTSHVSYVKIPHTQSSTIIRPHVKMSGRKIFIWFFNHKNHCKDFFCFHSNHCLCLEMYCWGGVTIYETQKNFIKTASSYILPHQHSTYQDKVFSKYIIHKKLYFFLKQKRRKINKKICLIKPFS